MVATENPTNTDRSVPPKIHFKNPPRPRAPELNLVLDHRVLITNSAIVTLKLIVTPRSASLLRYSSLMTGIAPTESGTNSFFISTSFLEVILPMNGIRRNAGLRPYLVIIAYISKLVNVVSERWN